MEIKTLYQDEHIIIIAEDEDIYLETLKKGYTFEQLNEILARHHEIQITNFSAIKVVINEAPKLSDRIGRLKDRIRIEILEEGLKAYITLNLSEVELGPESRQLLVREIMQKAKDLGICFGIKSELFNQMWKSGQTYLLAEGIPPINGDDAKIRMYQIVESRPLVQSSEKVDYYEHKIINRVEAGAWLGEKIEATEGAPGKSVRNEPISQIKGKSANLYYDKNTVSESTVGNVTTLTARRSGAVKFVDEKITVLNLLEIDGDVDFKTGNIKFDGFVNIKGTIADGFYVEATRDIEINGILGIGHVRGVVSTEGSIVIKGGIASRTGSMIKAKTNIFTKYVENATLICGEKAHIGYYIINSTVSAREVIIESANGHIIGGNVRAKIKTVVPIIGTEMGKRTVVEIEGFDRNQVNEELQALTQRLSEIKEDQQRAKLLIVQLSGKGQVNPELRKECENMIYKLTAMKEEIKTLEEKRKMITEYLKAKGEGELTVSKYIYPNCQLIICRKIIEINEMVKAVTYYSMGGELKQG